MAQTNYTPIILYNSGTTTNAPSASNLASGELAINYTDGKLFYKDNSSAIQVIGWKTTPTTAGGTGLTSYTAGDLPYYASGSALSKLGIGTSGYVLQSNGSAPTWVAQSTLSVGTATNATNTAITDNTSSSATWYPTIVSATTGNLPQTTSSTKLSFVPSTGTLTATSYGGAWAGSTIGTTYGGTGLTSLTAGYIPYGNGTSAFNSSSAFQFDGTNLKFGTEGTNGVKFGTGSSLNSYEEGSFTPVLYIGTTANSAGGSGIYRKIGNFVSFSLNFYNSSFTASGTGNYSIQGLPFTSNGSAINIMGVSYFNGYNSTTSGVPYGEMPTSSTTIFLFSASGSANYTNITNVQVSTTFFLMRVSGTYQV